jgi:hypothetical protein
MSRYTLLIALLVASIHGSHATAVTADQLAIVPGADVVGFIDFADLASRSSAKQDADGATTSLPQKLAARKARIEAATGLTEGDIVSGAFSCDIDTLTLSAATARERTANMQGVATVQLAKPLTIDQVNQALKLEYGSTAAAGVESLTIGGTAAMRIKASEPDEPDVYLAITKDKHVIVLSLNENALATALQRGNGAPTCAEPEPLARLRKTLPKGSQFQMACIVPPGVRASIESQINAMNAQIAQYPGLAAVMGFARLFQGVKNVCFGIQLDTDMLVSVAGELGGIAEAQQAQILLENVFIPMIQAQLLQQAGLTTPPQNMQEQVSVTTDDASILIRVKIPEEQLQGSTQQSNHPGY